MIVFEGPNLKSEFLRFLEDLGLRCRPAVDKIARSVTSIIFLEDFMEALKRSQIDIAIEYAYICMVGESPVDVGYS
ncbi:hypothetical protein D5S19_20715 [Amycolatopsis panacis]|uniref:Uncharacterized protein n=1 Tax=Amycolatopsis panacis TaxID=2340917 RepID=A0A419I0H5_9PSEU|nr:hypothetical protein D5S19_20715 [Amycolatopsis panacis]